MFASYKFRIHNDTSSINKVFRLITCICYAQKNCFLIVILLINKYILSK